ncbi:MAG TPA: nucleotide sugar dehydrogenase [Planctomycetota bacterium]|nr:nucleotide sugar dehydrogenase [Planctomycetota bacterium]
MTNSLEDAIESRTVRVGIIGLGYVGLPLVRAFHGAELTVIGFDIDPRKIETLNAGRSYIDTVATEDVARMVQSGRFTATADFDRLAEPDALIICVPTPLTKTREPDLSYVRGTAEAIARRLRPGQLVVLESTTYPGTTEEVLVPVLETSGLVAGKDFHVAFSPEREDPGNKRFNTRTIPKLVGGLDDMSGALAASLYQLAVENVVRVSHARVAEAAKILENVYRSVNIALVNELKVLFDRMGIDIWEVIDAAATKPFGFQAFYPGPGLGGHCIPIDPFYLTWKAREYQLSTRFIELAGEINTSMPEFVVHKVLRALNGVGKTVNGSQGLILGLAYKKNTDDTRESPAFEVIDLLQELGGHLVCHDPYLTEMPKLRRREPRCKLVSLTADTLSGSDYTLIVTDHDNVDWDFVVEHSQLVIDTRNATRNVSRGREKIVKA